MILNKIKNTIERYNMISEGDSIIVGLSGGPDSVCLLHVLSGLRESMGIKVYAAHLNHQIRGIEAHRDALYVSELCRKEDIPCFIKSVDVPSYCRDNGYSLEEGARKVRYDMFFEIKKNIGANKIAIGHNMNDQAETVLMRLMRGTGLQGLRGIEYTREDGIIRPLLDVERSEIEAYCEEHSLDPKIDKTNLESIYSRNRIRLELIPYMKEHFNPGVIESVVRMSNSLKNDGDYIDSEAEKIYRDISEKTNDGIEISVPECTELHQAILSRVIRYSIRDVLGDTNFVDMKHIYDVEELFEDSKNNKMLNLPRGLFVYRKDDVVIFTMNEIKYEDVEYSHNIPKNGFVKVKETGLIIETKQMSMSRFKGMKKDPESICVDADKIEGEIKVRNRQAGDKIKLKAGSKKLKDLFIDLKIPREMRSRIPVIEDENGIIAAGTYRTGENYIPDLNTKEVLKITIKKL